MDEANQELRITIKKIWPLQAKKVLDLIIPQDQGTFLSLVWARASAVLAHITSSLVNFISIPHTKKKKRDVQYFHLQVNYRLALMVSLATQLLFIGRWVRGLYVKRMLLIFD